MISEVFWRSLFYSPCFFFFFLWFGCGLVALWVVGLDFVS